MYSILFVALIAGLLIYRFRSGERQAHPVKIPVETTAYRRYLRKITRR